MSVEHESARFADTERQRIVKDIARWKCELEMDQEFTHLDLDEFVSMLREKSDDELESHWYDTVGEWLSSRTDLEVPPEQDFEAWIEAQFRRLVDGQRTDYGFVIEVVLPPTKA